MCEDKKFTGSCPYCGEEMQRIDSGHDCDLDRFYDRFVCLDCCGKTGFPDADVHVDTETGEVL